MYKKLSRHMQSSHGVGTKPDWKIVPEVYNVGVTVVKAKPDIVSPPGVMWPIFVTLESHDETFHVVVLKSRIHADQLGFDWIGRKH